MSAHTIRLRGPWELRAAGADHLAAIRVKLPTLWRHARCDLSAPARLSRRFGRPTGLAPHQRVWLCVAAAQPLGTVMLSGETLFAGVPESQEVRCDITQRLQSRNEIDLELEPYTSPDAADAPVLGEVWLEIDERR